MPDPQDLEVEQHPREGDRNPFWPPWPPNVVCMTVFLTACVGIFFRIAEWEHCAKGDESAVKAQTKPPNGQEKQKKWLPITASRKEKWWYSTFDNVTALVGAGVLGLPYAMSQLGWYPGVAAILVSWVVGFYSRWQLVEMHRMVLGKQFNRYFNLVKIQQLMVRVASTIVYCVIGGKSLKRFCYLIRPTLHMHSQTYFIVFFAYLQILFLNISYLKFKFYTLKGISLLGAVMSVSYSMVAFCTSIVKGIPHHPTNYVVRSHTLVGQTFDVFNALGIIAFAFAGHGVFIETKTTLPPTKEKPSKNPMWRGVIVAYTIVIACYLSVAISGFWAFGNVVEDDVLVSLEHPRWLIATANLMVFIHVLISFQVFAMPILTRVVLSFLQKWSFSPSLKLRIIAQDLYMVVVGFVAICAPSFGGLLGFFGGLTFTSTSYIIPSVMWLFAKKPKPWSLHWNASLLCVVFGTVIAAFAPIGGFRTIVVFAKTYKIFSFLDD